MYLHHDAITGTAKQYVADDYSYRMQRSMDSSSKVYQRVMLERMRKITGIESENLESCFGSNNYTVLQCPIVNHLNKTEFLVVAHNPSTLKFNRFIKVKLPNKNYKAQVWSKENLEFENVVSDVFEQAHFSVENKETFDYEMFVQKDLEPNEISFIKLIKLNSKSDSDTYSANNYTYFS